MQTSQHGRIGLTGDLGRKAPPLLGYSESGFQPFLRNGIYITIAAGGQKTPRRDPAESPGVGRECHLYTAAET